MYNAGTRKLIGSVSAVSEKALMFATVVEVVGIDEKVRVERWIPKSQVVAMKPMMQLIESLFGDWARRAVPVTVELWVKSWLVDKMLEEIRKEQRDSEKPLKIEPSWNTGGQATEAIERAKTMSMSWDETFRKEQRRKADALQRLDAVVSKMVEKKQKQEKELLECELGKGRKFFLDD